MDAHNDLLDRLDAFLHRVQAMTDVDEANTLAALDLTFSQARLLMLLSVGNSPLAIHEIAAALGLTLPSAGRNVDRLVRVGLVERQESPGDRRVKLVSLAPAGRELAERGRSCLRAVLGTLVAPLADEEALRLSEALEPLVRVPVLDQGSP